MHTLFNFMSGKCTKVIKQTLNISFTSRPRPLLTSQSNNRNDNVQSIQELRNNWSKAAKPGSHVFAEDRRSTSITAAISCPSVPAATRNYTLDIFFSSPSVL